VRLWHTDVAGLDGLSQMLYIDSRFSLADNLLLLGDKLSMAVSLEARVPFLDLELMEFVENIPPNLKIKGGTQKYILKKAISKWVPKAIITRRKIGFNTPMDNWFRRELRRFIEDRLLPSDSACNEFFKRETIQAMLDDHRSGRQDYKKALFCLLTFEIWYDNFIKSKSWRKGNKN
jgi:asparagine synthase (glutamine-hydrolysing)